MLIGAGLIYLLLVGLGPQALPFVPGEAFSDSVTAHWPAAYHLRQSVLIEQTFPYWQETTLAGGPFAANPLNKTAYPLQWLALLLPPALHLNVMILMHLILAGWGMWRWTRMLGLDDAPAVFSGLAFAFAPKMLAHVGAGHVDLIYALAWWPWLMAGIHQLVHMEKMTLRSMIPVGVFGALVFLGDVRLSLFAFAVALAYGVVEIVKTRRRLLFRRFVFPAMMLFMLTLAVTVPLLAWRPYMNRASLTTDDAGVFSLESGHLVGLLLPPHSGNPETITYLSLSVLLFAGIALVAAPRRHIFWGVALLVAVLYALGINGPLWPLLVDVLPFLLWFRVPSRAWFVVVFGACVLAGHGLQTIMQTVARLRDQGELSRLALKRLAIAGGMGASLFCGGFTLLMLSDLPSTIGIGVIAVGLVLGLVLLLGFYGRLSPHRLALALIVVLFLDVAWTGAQWMEWRAPDTWLTHQDDLVAALQADNPARIYSPNYALEQQVAAANDLHLFYGVDPFQLTGIADAISQGSGVPQAGYSVVLPPLILDEDDEDIDPDEALRTANMDAAPDTAILAQWAVSYVVATYLLDHERLSLLDTVGNVYVYRNLDYDSGGVQGWPHWDGLPDETTVSTLNQATLIATLFSGIAFAIAAILFVGRVIRQ